MTLRPDLMFFPLDDDVVVFSEEAQCLVALNGSAELIARNLHEGLTASEIANGFASEGIAEPAEAARWVSKTLDALGAHGLLADGRSAAAPSARIAEDQARAARLATMPAFVPFEPKRQQRYRLLNVCALIRFSMLEQVPWINSVIGHLATHDSAAPNITLDILSVKLKDGKTVRSFVYRDGEPVEFVTGLNRLGPVVKSALWQSAVNAHDFLFYLHAGVVGNGTSCVLLPAAPGSGKSSLTAALVHKGFRFFSDEVALIERGTFLVPPMPMALCVKSTGWDVIARYHPEIEELVTHERLDGKVVRYVPPPAHAIQQTGALVSHIIFPRYDKDTKSELKAIERSDALGRLMVECLALRQRLTPANIGQLLSWIAGINCYALTFSSLDEACELVFQVVGRANSRSDVPEWHNS